MSIGGMIGSMIGWSLGGPIGALIGFGIGTLFGGGVKFDTIRQDAETGRYRRQTGTGDFNVSFLVLSAAVMKADGKVLKSELNYVKGFIDQQFGQQNSGKYLKVLQGLLKKDIPLHDVCEQIRYNMQMPMRLQLLHYLFGIAKADGNVHSSEVSVIETIARYLRIPTADFISIKNMFFKEVDSAYKILEVDKSASDKEVKKAYRRMANRYHPDKVSQLGEDVQKGAKEKFQKIQDAYEQIKKERGMP